MLCAHCHREIEPEPYHRNEFRSPTADKRKLREAVKWYRRLGRCRHCYADYADKEQRPRIAEIVAAWKAAQTLPSGLTEVETIDALLRDWGVAQVAEYLKLGPEEYELRSSGDGSRVGFEETLLRIHCRRDALETLLHDPISAWRTTTHPRHYLKIAAKHNGDRLFEGAAEGSNRIRRIDVLFSRWATYNHPQTNQKYREGCRQFRATLASWGFHEAAIGVYAARLCECTRDELLEWARNDGERREIEAAWRWINRWRAAIRDGHKISPEWELKLWWTSDEVLVRCAHPSLMRRFPLPEPVLTRRQQRRRRRRGEHPDARWEDPDRIYPD